MNKLRTRAVLIIALCIMLSIVLDYSGAFAKQPYLDKAGFPAGLPQIGNIIQVNDPSDKSVFEGKILFRKLQKENSKQFKNGDVILYFDWQSSAAILYRNGQYFNTEGTKVYIFNTER